MTSPCLRSVGRAVSHLFRSQACRLFAVVLVAQMAPMARAFTPAATSTTLTISSSVVPYKTPITLTATVTAAGAPVSAGVVIFCDATAAFCETNSALAFDRSSARGRHLAIAAGTSVRFEPEVPRTVELVPFTGERVVAGFSLQVGGRLDG